MYSWYDFGREAEYVIAYYLKSKGWKVRISRLSRGAADILAEKDERLCIQVKASMRSVHIKVEEIDELERYASSLNSKPVLGFVQPWNKGVKLGNYSILFYSLPDWSLLQL